MTKPKLLERFLEIRRNRGSGEAIISGAKYVQWIFKNYCLRQIDRIKKRRLRVIHPDIAFDIFGQWTSDAGIGEDYQTTGSHEYPVTGLVTYILDFVDEPVFYDIGASIGYYSILATHYTKNSYIHSFEPNSIYLHTLQKNNSRLAEGDINIVDRYVGSIGLDISKHSNKYKPPSVIKIDIDGGEGSAIETMKGLVMDSNPPILLLEMHLFDNYEKNYTIANEFIKDNYRYTYVCKHHRMKNAKFGESSLDSIDKEKLISKSEWSDYMVLCIPEHKRELVKLLEQTEYFE
jgi:hypothetical protein